MYSHVIQVCICTYTQYDILIVQWLRDEEKTIDFNTLYFLGNVIPCILYRYSLEDTSEIFKLSYLPPSNFSVLSTFSSWRHFQLLWCELKEPPIITKITFSKINKEISLIHSLSLRTRCISRFHVLVQSRLKHIRH